MGKRKYDEYEDYAGNEDGSIWITATGIAKTEARRRWPDRKIKGLPDPKHDESVTDSDFTAEVHFGAVDLEGFEEGSTETFRVELGDYVEVDTDEGLTWVVEILELFQTTEKDRMFAGNWMYKHIDTSMSIRKRGAHLSVPWPLDDRLLFKATQEDNRLYQVVNLVNTILRVVKVRHRVPGGPIPQDCDFYWSMQHDRRHNSFWDFHGKEPAPAPHDPANGARVVRTLELYCGCGGLSFADRHTKEVIIETKWAVDYERSMSDTFQANYPYAHALCIGVDEFLALCQHWKRLCDKFPDDWAPKPGEPAARRARSQKDMEYHEVSQLVAMTVRDKGVKGKSGQGKGHLKDSLKEDDAWLEFMVLFKDDNRIEWVKETHLDCYKLLAAFVRRERAKGLIPLPGQVDCIMGGPPCQGVSGLNRHGKTTEITNDPRNRQVFAFYDTIKWFQPSFVLMENVLDIFKKGDGEYAKLAASILLDMDYQTRTGVIAACHHGASQGRWRAFMWGAKSGKEQLAPFPEPTHAAGFACAVPNSAKQCVVGFTSKEAFDQAHKMTFLGDVLSDLPEVSTFSTADRTMYAAEPQTPMQLYLRRDPPSWAASREHRARQAAAMMADTREDLAWKMQSLTMLVDPAAMVGVSYFCNKGQLGENEAVGNRTDMFSQETQRAIVRTTENRDPVQAETLKHIIEDAKPGLSHMLGIHILQENDYQHPVYAPDSDAQSADEDDEWEEAEGGEAEAALAAKRDWERPADAAGELLGELSDHRPLNLNADDFLRCSHVPPDGEYRNFRDFPEVVTNSDGTCCAGHCHAASHANGKQTKCEGGGTRTISIVGNTAASRVDHADIGGWRGGTLKGCRAFTSFLPTGDLLCPRWCITYKKGRSNGRHGCFGRMQDGEIQPTVVGRAEPHNLRLIHPKQDRVVTIRENARCQGFPDYFTFVGHGGDKASSWVRNDSVTHRYQQLGNAVCPLVAEALGRCLALAAAGKAPSGVFVVSVPNEEYDEAVTRARKAGLRSYLDVNEVHAEHKRHIERFGVINAAVQGLLDEAGSDDDDEEGGDIEQVMAADMAVEAEAVAIEQDGV